MNDWDSSWLCLVPGLLAEPSSAEPISFPEPLGHAGTSGFLREVVRASHKVTGLRDRKLICLTVDFGFILKIFCNFWLGGSTVSYLRTCVLGEEEKFARN